MDQQLQGTDRGGVAVAEAYSAILNYTINEGGQTASQKPAALSFRTVYAKYCKAKSTVEGPTKPFKTRIQGGGRKKEKAQKGKVPVVVGAAKPGKKRGGADGSRNCSSGTSDSSDSSDSDADKELLRGGLKKKMCGLKSGGSRGGRTSCGIEDDDENDDDGADQNKGESNTSTKRRPGLPGNEVTL
jgi:hypothetical protein